MILKPPAFNHANQEFPPHYLLSDLILEGHQTNSSFSTALTNSSSPLAHVVQNGPCGTNQFSTQPTSTVNPDGMTGEELNDDDIFNLIDLVGPSLLGTPPINVNSLDSSLVQRSLPPPLEYFPCTFPMMPLQQNRFPLSERSVAIPNQTVLMPQSIVPISNCETVKVQDLSSTNHLSVLSPEPIVDPITPSMNTAPGTSRNAVTSKSRKRFVKTRKVVKTSSRSIIEGDEPAEVKAEKEQRKAKNNAKERTRVRDIGKAFKVLDQKCSVHLPIQARSKVNILNKAIKVIFLLKNKVRERNMDPKRVCREPREDKENEEMPTGSLSNPGMQHLMDSFPQMMPHASSQSMNHHYFPMQ